MKKSDLLKNNPKKCKYSMQIWFQQEFSRSVFSFELLMEFPRNQDQNVPFRKIGMVSMATRKCNMCQFPIENIPFTFQIWKVCTKNRIILRILLHSPQKITLKHFWAYLSLFGHSDAPWWPKPVLKIPRKGTFSRVEPHIFKKGQFLEEQLL